MASRSRGRPSEGLSSVLFLRCSSDLIERLDSAVERARKKNPGRVVSRADIVREVLYAGLEERKEESCRTKPRTESRLP